MEQYKKDKGLQYIGTCVQCWIDNNPQLVINGFDRINYPYDKSARKIVKKSVWVKITLGFDLCMLGCIYALAMSGMLSEINLRSWGIGYAVWFSMSVISAAALDRQRRKNYVLRYQDGLFLTRPKDLDYQLALKYVKNAMSGLDFVQDIRYAVFSVRNYCICGVTIHGSGTRTSCVFRENMIQE